MRGSLTIPLHSCTCPPRLSAPPGIGAGTSSHLGFLRDPGDSFLTEDQPHTQGQISFISHSQLSLFFKKKIKNFKGIFLLFI